MSTALWAVGDVVDGRYEVRRVAGVGGMGQVLQVWHRQWDIDLAVKCPKAECFETTAQRELFVAEAEAWVSLGLHPNICGCHYVRLFDGVPRVFAEYVSGGSLRDWIADRRLYTGGPEAATALALDLAVQIAWGLGHAHDRGLIHQDVKPANILLDAHRDDVLIAKVTDFGLARSTPSVGGMTRAYAAPEQFMGQSLGQYTDIFSFAVSVLEIFTGGVSWPVGPAAGEALEARRVVGAGIPPIPPGLADLLARCLQTEPTARPASMADVAAEITGVYQQTTGRRYPRVQPQAADLRGDELNNRALSLLDLDRTAEAETTFASALAADPQHAEATFNAGLLRWRRSEITDEELIADLDAVRRDSEDSWPARRLLGLAHLERGDVAAARPLLERVDRELPGQPEVRTALRSLDSGTVADARCAGTREIHWYWTRPGWADPLLKVDVSADGRRAVTGGVDDNVQVWDVRTGRRLHTLEGRAHAKSVRITPDGAYAASVEGNSLRLWNLADGTCLRTIETSGRLEWAAMSARTGIAVAAEYARPGAEIVVWDLRSRQVRWRLHGLFEQFVEAELSPDGRWVLAAGYEDCAARLWDLETGQCQQILGAEGIVNPSAVCFDVDAGVAVIAGMGGRNAIDIWDLDSGVRVRTLSGHTRFVASLALSRDGGRLLSASLDGTIRLWELESGRCVRTFRGHEGEIRHVQWAANEHYALSAGEDDTVRLWRLPSPFTVPAQLSRPREHRELSLLDEKVESLVGEAARQEAAGDRAAAITLLREAREVPGYERAPNVVAAWRSLSRSAVRTGLRAVWTARAMAGHKSGLMSVDVTADGRIAASGGLDHTVRLWDLDTGRCLRAIPHPKDDARVEAFDVVQLSADGTRVMASDRRGSVYAWSVETGECLYSVNGDRLIAVDTRDPMQRMIGPLSRGPRSTRFSADGKRALIGGYDRAYRFWDLESGACLRTLVGHEHPVQGSWIGGELAATSGADHTVRLWDLRTGRCLHILEGHTHWVMTVSLSPDGRFAISAGGYTDNTIRVWDVVTGDCLAVFDEQAENTSAVRLTPDGRSAVSGGKDSTLRVWDVGSGRCLRAAEAHPGGVASVALTSDGQFVVSGGSDGMVRLWALDWELAAK